MLNKEFSDQVINAIEAKKEYFNAEKFPQLLEKYRLLHTYIKSVIEILTQKGLIKPDPYKHERKISDIELIPNEPFNDSERSLVIGTRLSDYEFILDFICTYYKFSMINMNFAQIKKITEFNNSFLWSALSESTSSSNTKGLAVLINEAKRGLPAFTINSLNDNISKSAATIKDINLTLKELNEFQKESYKAFIRKEVFNHSKFNYQKAEKSLADEQLEIKAIFPLVANKMPYYPTLIEEIAKEDLAPDKQQLQNELLKKLQVEKKENTKKQTSINSKEILMTAVQTLSGVAIQLEPIIAKLKDNRFVLDAENNSFFRKFIQLLRKAFGIEEPPVVYTVNLTDPVTSSTTKEKIDFKPFVAALEKKVLFYNSFSLKTLPGYQKIEKSPIDKILEFLNKQISESQKILMLLTALDDFFKTAVSEDNKHKIKGIKMELTTFKNTIVNANQHRADYLSVVEEQEQMKKLGIENA